MCVLPTTDRDALLAFATDVATDAGTMLLHFLNTRRHVATKTSTIDLVTEVDERTQAYIVERIQRTFPTHGIIAEEDDMHMQGSDEFMWVIDPLDGTTNYWHHYPLFCVSIGLSYGDALCVGVVYAPVLRELFVASCGGGAWCNTTRLHVSTTSQLDHALVATGFPYDRLPGSDNNVAEFGNVMPFVQGVRRTGTAALDLAFVAAGRTDAYWEFHVRPWDTHAGRLLVAEAGGRVTTVRPHGEMHGAGGILATNGHIHNLLQHRLRGTDV
jgi:myo-inositol-1(or 4)-monophosphatase